MSTGEQGASPYDKTTIPRPTSVSTHKFNMQTRICAGGCGKEFRVLSTSKQTRAIGDCERRCAVALVKDEKPVVKTEAQTESMKLHDFQPPKEKIKMGIAEIILAQPMADKAKEIQARKKALKAESKKRLEKKLVGTPTEKPPEPSKAPAAVQKLAKIPTQTTRVASDIKGYDRQKNAEAKWNELVNKAKAKVQTMHRARMEVAALAMEACDIKWGGGEHWTGHKNVKTMKAFATEIQVSYKTLAQWVRVKRNIHDKLPPGVWQDDKYMIAMRVDRKTKRNAKPKDVMQAYLKELERKDDGLILQQACKRLSTLHFFIHQKIRWTEVDQAELREMRDYCADIMDRINLELGEKYERPEDAEFDLTPENT